jgi:hypothetical protein
MISMELLFSQQSKSNLGFILILILFSYFWVRFSSGVTLKLFRPMYQSLKSRKKISVDALFKLGLFFQTTILLMAYAVFLILIPQILDLLYPSEVQPPTSMIAFSIVVFFCLNWIVGLRRWDMEIEKAPDSEKDSDPPHR